MGSTLIENIQNYLMGLVDVRYKKDTRAYFKGKIDNYGVRTPAVRKIARYYFKQIKGKSKEGIFGICEQLFDTGKSENIIIAFQWAYRIKNRYEKGDFERFEQWLEEYVYNWGACDDLCVHAFGELIYQYPGLISKVKRWTMSNNIWKRRAAAVVMIYSIRREQGLNNVFEIADLLLYDDEDIVQKGYGWMLKEASNIYPEEVFEYVMNNRKDMPRTSLRYAIEKMPEKKRKLAMGQDS